jgi:hypothetical protein
MPFRRRFGATLGSAGLRRRGGRAPEVERLGERDGTYRGFEEGRRRWVRSLLVLLQLGLALTRYTGPPLHCLSAEFLFSSPLCAVPQVDKSRHFAFSFASSLLFPPTSFILPTSPSRPPLPSPPSTSFNEQIVDLRLSLSLRHLLSFPPFHPFLSSPLSPPPNALSMLHRRTPGSSICRGRSVKLNRWRVCVVELRLR